MPIATIPKSERRSISRPARRWKPACASRISPTPMPCPSSPRLESDDPHDRGRGARTPASPPGPPEVPVPPVVEMPPPPRTALASRYRQPHRTARHGAGEIRARDVGPITRFGGESSLDGVHAGSADHLSAAPAGDRDGLPAPSAPPIWISARSGLQAAASRANSSPGFSSGASCLPSSAWAHGGRIHRAADDGGRARHQRCQSAGKHGSRRISTAMTTAPRRPRQATP
jgi:hypothetical protein